MGGGTVIFLNGGSSSGKTRIAKALQESLDGYYLHTGIDHYMERLPAKFDVISDGSGAQSAEGFLLVFPGGGRQIGELRPGPTGFRLLESTYAAYAALAAGGVDLIIDDLLFAPRLLAHAATALAPYNTLFVGVRCPLEEAERRERERGDRIQGLARLLFAAVHAHGRYDLEVDTAQLSAEECAARIRARLVDGPPPAAFRELAAAHRARAR